ncbi:cell wall hydrolase [Alicyclobacillus acidocaldarius]|nr:cell wall hydrolase [Alicyclobacillus acidocaldarius]
MPFRTWIAGCAMVATAALSVSNASAETVTVEPGQSLWTIAHSHGLPVQLVEDANPDVNPQNLPIGSSVKVPEVENVTVKRGDTLFLLGKRFGVSTSEMLAANPAVNPLNLQVGSTVRVPVGPSRSSHVPQAHVAASTPATSSELYWLEHVIHAEAGGEPLQAQIAVGDVIMHRIQAGGYGNTVQQVVFQVSDGHYQFESVANGYIYSQPDAQNVQAALDALNGDDVVPGALVFYNPSETPSGSWVWSQPVVSKIGHLVFAK